MIGDLPLAPGETVSERDRAEAYLDTMTDRYEFWRVANLSVAAPEENYLDLVQRMRGIIR